MTLTLPKTCSMGSSKTGLVGTIGVALLNPDGTVHTARATANIYEIGGGSYGKQIGFDDNWIGSIKWDTGGGTPVYATEEYNYYMNNPKVDTILTDTNELQTNQGNWITAVGFSTHAAADIWSIGTRALTDKSNFGLSTASINLIWDDLISGMTAGGSIGKLIADNLNASITSRAPSGEYDTEAAHLDVDVSSRNNTTPPTVTQIRQEMDSNSTKMAPSQTLNDYKATGFSTHTAANVWSVVTRSLTDKSGFSLSTVGIKAIWDQLTNVLTTIGSIGKLLVDNVNATISSRNSTIPDVAGTAATLHGITDGKIDVMDTIVDAIKSKTDNLPSGITKNEALPKFSFLMVLSSDHVTAATGKTITGEISKNGGSFTAITNTITEISNGMYTIAGGFTQEEMNADIVALKFDGNDCDTSTIIFVTT